MVKLVTTAEYLPPLPSELPAETWARIRSTGGTDFNAEQRADIGAAALRFVEALYRHVARPSVGKVRQRLKRVLALLSRPISDADTFCTSINTLLEMDEIGDVLLSLGLSTGTEWRTLPINRLERRRLALHEEARVLQRRLDNGYPKDPGREPRDYIDELIERLEAIDRRAGGNPNAFYNHIRENRETPFVRLVGDIANEALRCFAPAIWAGEDGPDGGEDIRESLTYAALGERAHIVINPGARERRTARVRDNARRRQSER